MFSSTPAVQPAARPTVHASLVRETCGLQGKPTGVKFVGPSFAHCRSIVKFHWSRPDSVGVLPHHRIMQLIARSRFTQGVVEPAGPVHPADVEVLHRRQAAHHAHVLVASTLVAHNLRIPARDPRHQCQSRAVPLRL
jgi:hypothetical protein